MNISGIDLNLMVIFDALMKERSVSKAAKRVGLSQPATSNALARLRTLFDDPLLVRQGNRMVPTDRALGLVPHIHAGLTHFGAALEDPESFDPATTHRFFNIAADDYVSFVLLTSLLQRLRDEAPNITVRVVQPDGSVGDRMSRGEVDLGFGVAARFPDGVAQQLLFQDGFVFVCREGHPRVGKRITLRQFVALDHLLIAPFGSVRGVVDEALEGRGLERRISLYLPNFPLAAPVLAETDLVAVMAERLARVLAPRHGLRVLPTPLPVGGFAIRMFWDPRHENVPAHRWLRETVVRTVDETDA